MPKDLVQTPGAIAVAASCAFATPVGTSPNTLVFGPGNYRFMDYVQVGIPLIIICFILVYSDYSYRMTILLKLYGN
ncbi:anion permease [Thermanaerosceptrum fracticalcis]|uniref:anion permease n=1 Tax=Thermanaerosceptrum fracticalcis TaxID=1712410 RepID=UPI001A9C0FDC|nr:anion permease [Thermanaerosceptrum fracticalcis]